jgi:hypothetical protein
MRHRIGVPTGKCAELGPRDGLGCQGVCCLVFVVVWVLGSGDRYDATTAVTLRFAGRDRRTVSGRELPRT